VTFRFNTFVLDEDSRQLLRGGREVHLSPKAFDLLLQLIRTRPRALSKTELHQYLWPGTFVTDASLGMLVTEIRSALGDKARRPRFVRTVHRFGYAFQGDVTEIPESARRAARPSIVCWLVSPTRQIMLQAGENMVGRDPHAAVWLDSPGISRHHARITVGPGSVVIEDLGSKNGTHARGEPISRATPLADGDEIRFGSTSLTFRIWTSSGSTASEA
jgi:DNA-binding winged helix-turn-helix (wHTH) protein